MKLRDYLGAASDLAGKRVLSASKDHLKLEGTIVRTVASHGDVKVHVQWDNGDKSTAWLHMCNCKLRD
jgi:hypothetical protein